MQLFIVKRKHKKDKSISITTMANNKGRAPGNNPPPFRGGKTPVPGKYWWQILVAVVGVGGRLLKK